MSDKKVNSKMLKNLIKEVLEEQRLDEKTLPYDTNQAKVISDLGLLGRGFKPADIKNVAKKGSKSSNTDLDVDDFEASLKLAPSNAANKTTKNIQKNTNNDEVRDAIVQAAQNTTTASPEVAQATATAKKQKKFTDFSKLSRSTKNNKNNKVSDVLESNQALGAGLSVPEVKFDQLVSQKGTQDALWDLISQKLGSANDIEDALKKICSFINDVQLGNYTYAATGDKDKISELISKMAITQSLMNILRGYEYSPMGFLMENWFGMVIQGQVAGSNQEAEDLIHVGPDKVTLYSSKFIDGLGDPDLGVNTAETLSKIMGRDDVSKYPDKEISDTITYIYGVKDKPNNPTGIEFYKGEYSKAQVKNAMKTGKLPVGKTLKPIEGCVVNLTDSAVSGMMNNFAALANDLAVDLNAVYKSMNNFKILINTYFLEWDSDIAVGAKEEFKVLKTGVNKGFAKGGAGVKLEEQKITSDYLKKIIQETLKK